MLKYIILFFTFILSIHCFAFSNNESTPSLGELANRLAALEKVVEKKLGDCHLVYKHHTYRSNRCDRGTFARAVTSISSSVQQLECGYYQIQCPKSAD